MRETLTVVSGDPADRNAPAAAAPARPGAPVPPRPLLGVAIAALFFAAIAPTLGWVEFFNSMENLNVATSMETLREGHWLVPTLQGRPRIVKPPLPGWLTALTVRPQTFAALNDPDTAARDRAYARFAWEVRSFSLLCACATLWAVYELGRVIGGWRLGQTAALVCGTTFFFLRFSRLALTDVHLALWVTVTNVFLAKAVLQGRRWLGCAGAGIALGLALMSKGPVAIVESVVPVLLFAAWRRLGAPSVGSAVRTIPSASPALVRTADPTPDPPPQSARPWVGPILLGLALLLAVEVPWYVCVIRRLGGQWTMWRNEVTGNEADGLRPDPLYSYLYQFFLMLLPWVVFFIGGVGVVLGRLHPLRRRRAEPLLMALLLLVVPVLIMSFFRLKKDRYLLPMAGPAAIVAAAGLLEHFKRKRDDPSAPPDRGAAIGAAIGAAAHWTLLALFCIGVPLAGAAGWSPAMHTEAGRPVYSVPFAVAIGALLGAILLAGVLLHRRGRREAILAATAAVMLILQAVFVAGFARSYPGRNGYRPLAEKVRAAYPDTPLDHANAKGKIAPVDLSLYLNRTIENITPADAAALVPGERPRLAVMQWRGRADDPSPSYLPGWAYFDRIKRGGDWWYVFVLPAKAPARPGASESAH